MFNISEEDKGSANENQAEEEKGKDLLEEEAKKI